MTRCILLVLSATLSTTGCGPKKAATSSTEAKSASTPSTSGLTKFQTNLVETKISDWEPTSNTGAQFLYNTLQFDGDGTWNAQGVVKANFEEFECTESGSWSVTSEESATSGTVLWDVKKTDCITREVGTEVRTHFDLSGGKYQISFR